MTEGRWIEIAQINGIYMYFSDNESYTMAMSLYENGKLEIVKSDKNEGELKTVQLDLSNVLIEDKSNDEKQTVINCFKNIENAVLEKEIVLAISLDDKMYSVSENKSVEVNNTYPYRAGRTEYGYCYVGDKSAAYVSSNKVKEDYDFRYNTALLKKGIQNYIDFN